MCQHSTKNSGRLNIMLISTTMQLQNGLQLAQLNAGPATGVVFQRPHLHNKTEMAFSNFDLLQNSKDFNSRGQQNSLQWRWASSSSSAPASGYTRRIYEFWLPSTPENSKMRHFLWNYYHLEKILYNERSILKNRRAYLKKEFRRQDNKCSSQTILLLYSTIFGMRTYLQRKETAD